MIAVFLRILNNAVLSSFVIGAVILMRFALRRSPKWMITAAWALVAIRLMIPVSLTSPLSLIPDARPLEAIGLSPVVYEEEKPVTETAPGNAAPAIEVATDASGHDASAQIRRPESAADRAIAAPPQDHGASSVQTQTYSDVTDAAQTSVPDNAPYNENEQSEKNALSSPAPSNDAPERAASENGRKAAADEAATAGGANAPSNAAAAGDRSAAAHATGKVGAWVWLAAAIALIVFEIGSYIVTRLRLRTATRLEDNVFLSERIPGPFVLGFIRPRIYMPYRMSAETARYALAHEKAHVKRRDNLVKPLAFALAAVYWFDPLVWLAYVLFCRDIELACDEKVIRAYDDKERRAYASALLEIGSGKNVLNTVICPLAFGNISVKERIKKVVNYKKVSALAVAAAIALGALTAAFFLTDPISADNDGNIRLTAGAKDDVASEKESAEGETEKREEETAVSEKAEAVKKAASKKTEQSAQTTAESAEDAPEEAIAARTENAQTKAPAETEAPAEAKATETKAAETKTAETKAEPKPAETKEEPKAGRIESYKATVGWAIVKVDEFEELTDMDPYGNGFVANNVIVTFTHEALDYYYKFSGDEFPEIDWVKIHHFTYREPRRSYLDNTEQFHHIVLITLKDKDIGAVERAITALSPRIGKDLLYVEPDIILSAEPTPAPELSPKNYTLADGHSGDANADGVTDVEDVKAIVAVVKAGRRTVEDGAAGDLRDPYAADVNGDGKINARDMTVLGGFLGYTDEEIVAIADSVEAYKG